MPANSRWDLIRGLNNLNDPDRPQCVKKKIQRKCVLKNNRENILQFVHGASLTTSHKNALPVVPNYTGCDLQFLTYRTKFCEDF